jgi:hypothetical protein
MKSLFHLATAACFAALISSPQTASSFGDGTSDEAPPAEESICEDAGYAGAALGLCVAFCEANDCDVEPDGAACDRLRANYTRISGDLAFPCELPDYDEPR